MLSTLRICGAAVGARFQQNTTLLRSVRRRRREATGCGSQTPFLDIGLDKDETGLTKVDVDHSRTVGANSGKEVLRFETMNYLLEFLAVASKENSTCSRAVAHTDDVALHQLGTVGSGAKGLVVATGSGRLVPNRVLVVSWETRVSR